MKSGWVKIYRGNATDELQEKYPNAFLLLSLIARRARRNDDFSVDGLSIGEAFIGDYLTCGLTEQKYRTAKVKLENMKIITCKATSRGTIAKLIDTSIYDINEDCTNGRSNGQPTDDQRTSNGQPTDGATTNKKLLRNKERKNVKKERIKEYPPDSQEFELASYLLNEIKTRKPDFREPNMQSWAGSIEAMIRLDGRKPERIRQIIAWSQADPFWKNNILCADKLRDGFDRWELLEKDKVKNGQKVTGNTASESRRPFGEKESSYGETMSIG